MVKTTGEPLPVGVTGQAIRVCLVFHVDTTVVAVMTGGGVTALADPTVRGIRKNKLGRLLVNNRILHSWYTAPCYGASNKTQIVSRYIGMGIGALLGDVRVVTGSAINDRTSTVYLVIAHTAHACCLSIWIVAGFADSFLRCPPWHVHVDYATFIGNVVTVCTRYTITCIMGRFLGLDGKRE